MNNTGLFRVSLASVLFCIGSAAFAQNLAQNEEAAVWALVEEAWNAAQDGERDWPDRLLSDDFSGWSRDVPVPRGQSSIKMWDRVDEQIGKVVAHELYPYTIVVHGGDQ